MGDAGEVVKGGSANFGLGQGAPSLQVNRLALMVWAVKTAARAGEGGEGADHSLEVAGQQSQSILASIWSNVRPLCSVNT
jgi:hypothetical protein